jgi:hypothetical protein
MDTNLTTDALELDELNTTTDSDDEGTSNVALGAVCVAAGVAIGAFVVPPVVGFVRGLFGKSEPAEVVAIAAAPEETPEETAV